MLVMLAGIFGLIGFVVWDRKTALKPLEQRMVRLEQEVRADLQAHHGEDSELKRLLKALRAFAAQDERLAKALRQFSLL
jgi:SOS response regulatory protein OraA/RecX